MTDLQKAFEKTGYAAWINSDIYPDGRIYTKEYTEWLERQINKLISENMTHEFNNAEAERFRPEYERQICERFAEYIGESGLKMYPEGWCEPGGSNGAHFSTYDLYTKFLGEHTPDH